MLAPSACFIGSQLSKLCQDRDPVLVPCSDSAKTIIILLRPALVWHATYRARTDEKTIERRNRNSLVGFVLSRNTMQVNDSRQNVDEKKGHQITDSPSS
jgi:hypothetical protein